MKFLQLILIEIIKIVAIRCQILRLIRTKFDFGWGSAPDPDGGAYSAPQPLAGLERPTSKGRGGKGKEGREGKRVGEEMGGPTFKGRNRMGGEWKERKGRAGREGKEGEGKVSPYNEILATLMLVNKLTEICYDHTS